MDWLTMRKAPKGWVRDQKECISMLNGPIADVIMELENLKEQLIIASAKDIRMYVDHAEDDGLDYIEAGVVYLRPENDKERKAREKREQAKRDKKKQEKEQRRKQYLKLKEEFGDE